MQARSMSVKLIYNKKDISKDLAPFLKSFDFKDASDDNADDISLTLEDRRELWESDWLPGKGDSLQASLVESNWTGSGEREYPLGTFEIDEIEISGLPHEVKIKGISVPENNELRGVQKNKSWEHVKLSAIAQEIADNAGLKLYLNIHDDKELDRVEQKEESDLSFLRRVAKEKSHGVRVSDTQLDVYYIPDLDTAEPLATVERESSRLASYSFRSKTRDTYQAAHVRYENTNTGELIEYTFTDENKQDGKTLELHQQVADAAEAETLAKAQLREKNKDEVTGSLSFGGLPRLFAASGKATAGTMCLSGFTLALSGFHAFDGKYLVTDTSHSLGSGGYSCKLEIRKCLNGY